MLSEKQARAIDKYIRVLVRRQPSWLKKLFEKEQILFSVEEDNSLTLQVREDLNPNHKQQAQLLISKYIHKHPTDAFKIREVH